MASLNYTPFEASSHRVDSSSRSQNYWQPLTNCIYVCLQKGDLKGAPFGDINPPQQSTPRMTSRSQDHFKDVGPSVFRTPLPAPPWPPGQLSRCRTTSRRAPRLRRWTQSSGGTVRSHSKDLYLTQTWARCHSSRDTDHCTVSWQLRPPPPAPSPPRWR